MLHLRFEKDGKDKICKEKRILDSFKTTLLYPGSKEQELMIGRNNKRSSTSKGM